MTLTQQQELAGTRFGTICFQSREVIRFPKGLIGFEFCQRFLLVSTMENGSFQWLQSIEQPGLAFLVTDPCQYVPSYAPPVGSWHSDECPNQLLLATVTIPKGKPEEMSLNLAGPIVVDLESKLGRQIVLEDEAYTTKYRVFAKASHQDEDVAA